MSEQTGYISLPRAAQCNRKRQTVLIINGTAIPVVPAGSCLVFVAGLVMWTAGMLQARDTVDGIFSDLGLTAESLDHLKATVLASVIVMLVLAVAALAANMWLEVKRATGAAAAQQAYAANSLKVNAANWVLLLLVAFAMAGSITWLTTMSTALSATQQTGSFGTDDTQPEAADASATHNVFNAPAAVQVHWASSGAEGVATAATLATKPTTPKAAPEAAPEAAPAGRATQPLTKQGLLAGLQGPSGIPSYTPDDVGQLLSAAARTCPPGCVDLGIIAQMLGLPWPCFCQVWLLRDLVEQLQKVVVQLWVAVSGAVLLFAAVSWVYGFLAAESVHAAYEAQGLTRAHAGGSNGSSA